MSHSYKKQDLKKSGEVKLYRDAGSTSAFRPFTPTTTNTNKATTGSSLLLIVMVVEK